MKQNPDAPPIAEMIKFMRQGTGTVREVPEPGEQRRPLTPEERAEQAEALATFVIKVVCIGCDAVIDVDETIGQCECGGFVCADCIKVEEEGICNHEPPTFLPDPDDLDDD